MSQKNLRFAKKFQTDDIPMILDLHYSDLFLSLELAIVYRDSRVMIMSAIGLVACSLFLP